VLSVVPEAQSLELERESRQHISQIGVASVTTNHGVNLDTRHVLPPLNCSHVVCSARMPTGLVLIQMTGTVISVSLLLCKPVLMQSHTINYML